MKKIVFATVLFALMFLSCKNTTKNAEEVSETDTISEMEETTKPVKKTEPFTIYPISHATMAIEWDHLVFYIDPVGDPVAFEGLNAPDLIMVTDVHGDHFNQETIKALLDFKTLIIAPKAVFELLSQELQDLTIVMNNGEMTLESEFEITAIPMYNLREEALHFHEKGRGNGYLIEKDNYRVYISGDTEDIPEMRNLKNIDLAFVCMNLPYTMPVEQAADAVSEFKPKTVIPYHYRGVDGLSDISIFQKIVNEKAPEVEIKLLDWY